MKGRTLEASEMITREDFLKFEAFANRCGLVAKMPAPENSSSGIPFVVKDWPPGRVCHLYTIVGVDLPSNKLQVREMGMPYSFLAGIGDGHNTETDPAVRMMHRLLSLMPGTGLEDDRLAELMVLISESHYAVIDSPTDYQALFKHEVQERLWDYAVGLLFLDQLTFTQRAELAKNPVPLDFLKSGIAEKIPYSLLTEMSSRVTSYVQ